MARSKEEASLADRIGDKLEEAGYERKPGTNEFTVPSTGIAEPGHNSGDMPAQPDQEEGTNFAAEQLRLFIERVERLESEKQGIADDVKDVYAEAKANGYDTKTMRKIVQLRKMEKHLRDEADALLDTYRSALGMA